MSGEANWLGPIERDDSAADFLRNPERRRVVAELQAELDRRDRAHRDVVIDLCIEAAIVVLTFVALWLVTGAGPYARWGNVLGLASQPFYLAATWRANRWGMFIVAALTCGIWAHGIAKSFF